MTYAIAPGTRIGHVHLKVSDLDRAIAFYRDVLGLRGARSATARRRPSCRRAAITTTSG